VKEPKPAVVAPTDAPDRTAILEARVAELEAVVASHGERIAALEVALPPAGWVVPVVVFAERPTVVATRMSGGVWSISNGHGEQANGRTLPEAIAALPPGVLTGSAPLRRSW
jgi:hypothetical protein